MKRLRPNNSNFKCPVCNLPAKAYVKAVKHYSINEKTCILYRCSQCAVFFKGNEEDSTYKDFELVGINTYNTIQNYDHGYNLRFKFLNYIYNFTVSNLPASFEIKSWLDYGSGMGYLLMYLKRFYSDLAAVELAQSGRDFVSQRGIPAYSSFDGLPVGKRFDVISSIDSFYYSLEPKKLIDSFYSHLNENGYIVLRVSLRNFLIRFNKFFNRLPDDSLGDHFVGYNYKTIVKLFVDNGFEKIESSFREDGKSYYNYKLKIYSYIANFVYFITVGGINLHSGVTIIFKKRS